MTSEVAVQALAEALRTRIGGPRYELWFDGKTTLAWQDDRLVVGVPNHMYLDYLKKAFLEIVEQTAREALGCPVHVDFVLDPELFRQARQRQQQASSAPDAASGVGASFAPGAPSTFAIPQAGKQPAAPRQRAAGSNPRARRWKRLEDFVVGPCNRVAHASTLHVLEEPGQGPNPLVLHGPCGTGKTHLLQGLCAGLGQRHPDLRVVYLTAEEFTNRFLAAMSERRLAGFRKQVRECDALLLDDLHFLAKKQATMEEFLHTFDALHAADCPLAVTCDCHPRLADDLLPELVDRLLGGAVWSLAPPEEETRLSLLRKKALQLGGAPLADDVASYLARQLRGNVRELEGAVHALLHLARVTGRRIDLALAGDAAADVLRHNVRVLHLDEVDQAVCRALGLAAGALQSKQRGWAVSHPRMLAMFLARKHTAATYTEIGRRFGRNHSTAVAGEKRVRGWVAQNASVNLGQRAVAVRELVERIERELLR